MVQMAPDRLTRFLALGENIMALAQETGEPIAVLLNWLEQPSIADTIARYHAAQNAARVQAALSTLHRIVSESSDPTEQRRAATTLLRTLASPAPAACPVPRASCPPRSSPKNRNPVPSSNSMPQCPMPRCLPSPSTDASSPAITPAPPPASTPTPTFQDFQLATLELHRSTETADFAFNPALAVYLPLPDRFPKYPAHLSLGPDADFFHFASSLLRLPDSS